ncbi:hypothetical protein Cgig2_013716 [Carnegiea gigantea]|uniref:Phosphatidic acid phosphatase type 2/haloperoxidase domain-containing protein n=1 Tax=Carnegiea gigantea TaxID=171969 RepID=A0A9Q1GGT3_9CARY|nr:hypothetical protein Cgig2_000542 [Carnegiea gigantea]KAJ8437797.1 hypothetical protein Cgig2_013716 [Carnegiea gigantea]
MADKPTPPPEQPQLPPTPPPSSFLSDIVNLDTAWSSRIHALAEPVIPRAALKLLEISGDGRLWFPITIALLLSPLSLHSPNLYTFSLRLLLGLIVDIAVVGATKHLVRRRRPIYNKAMGLTFAVDHWSFPSGHASRVCFVASLSYLSLSAIAEGLDQLKIRKGEIVDRWVGNRDSGNVAWVHLFSKHVSYVISKLSRLMSTFVVVRSPCSQVGCDFAIDSGMLNMFPNPKCKQSRYEY